MQDVHALLFDLGGVLVNIDFRRALKAWAKHSSRSTDEISTLFRLDHQYERHERGEITAEQYFEHVAKTLHLTATVEQIEEGWNSIFVGEFTETTLMVRQARASRPCYAFTNTNGSHMQRWASLYPGVVEAFDRIFASHQLGLRKPEQKAFEYICTSIQVPPAHVLFFDDLEENVGAAISAGLQAVLVQSPQDVARALHAHGVA